MAELVYVACAITSTACAALLTRSFLATRNRLLLWTALCFVGLAANNVLLVVDLVLVTDVDLSTLRIVPAVAGFAALVYGLVTEAE
jgi:hypothetical protein